MRLLPLIALPLALCACAIDAQDVASANVAGTMFFANKRGASLSRIDLATGAETHRADTCENPHELAVSPDADYVMVACYSGSSVEIYAAADLAPVRVIELGGGARVHSAVWHSGGRVHAGAEGNGSVVAMDDPLDPEARMITIPGPAPGPHLLAVNAGDFQVWGTIIPTGEIVRWHVLMYEEEARRTLGGQPEAIALSPDGTALWVGSNADAKVWRLDPQTLETLAEIPVGDTPIRIAAHPSGDWVVTSNFGSGDLSVIDTATNEVVRTIPVSGSREAVQVTLVFSPDGERLYAAETARDTIAEVDFASGEVLRRIATGPGGDGLAITD
jgi:YVTN family beta-propeller protein